MRLFSFCAFSYVAHFHSTPSPVTPIFIPRHLLRRLFSFTALSYGAPLQKQNTGTLPVKLVVHGTKDMRDERPTPPPPPTLSGINPPPPALCHAPFMPGQRGDLWWGGGGDFDPFPLQTSVQCRTTKEEELPTYFIWRLLL